MRPHTDDHFPWRHMSLYPAVDSVQIVKIPLKGTRPAYLNDGKLIDAFNGERLIAHGWLPPSEWLDLRKSARMPHSAQGRYKRGVLGALAVPARSQDWNQKFVEILSLFGLELSDIPTQAYHVKAPASAPDMPSAWKEDTYIVEKLGAVPVTPESPCLYHWSAVEALAGYSCGDIIVMADNVAEARVKAAHHVHGYLLENRPYWFTETGEVEDYSEDDYSRFFNKFVADLEKDPEIIKDATVFVRGCD